MRDEPSLDHLIRRILAIEPHALDCGAVLEAIHRYVEVDVKGGNPGAAAPGVPEHLMACPDCLDMYNVLFELVELESDGRLPDLRDLWKDIEALTRPADPPIGATPGRLQTTTPPAPASIPQPPATGAPTTAPRPSVEHPDRPPAARWRPWLVPAAACAAAAIAAIGWWGAASNGARAQMALLETERRLATAEAELTASRPDAGEAEGYARMVEMLRRADAVGFARGQDGAWARVFFSPGETRAVVLLGGMPPLDPGQRLEGWIVRSGDDVESTGDAPDEVVAELDCWTVTTRTPLAAGDSFVLTIEPGHAPVVTVPLVAAR